MDNSEHPLNKEILTKKNHFQNLEVQQKTLPLHT